MTDKDSRSLDWTTDSPSILVVDDEKNITKVLKEWIERAGFNCLTANSAENALKLLEANRDVDVVVTDIIMPGMNGLRLTKEIKTRFNCDVIMMTGYVEDFRYEEVISNGASDFLHKPVSFAELLVRIKRVLREREVLEERNRAEQELRKSIQKLQEVVKGVVEAMAAIVEMRDPYTAGHQKRVAQLAGAIAREMQLPDDTVDGIQMAAAIHDIGKLSVPAEILTKSGPLNDIEFALIKIHPQAGYEMLKQIDFPWPIADIVLQHHERLDGSGYPQGLKNGQILLESRILSVADVVESMASHRPYRPALGMDKAVEEIRNHSGLLYDPEVAQACIELLEQKGFEL